MRVCQPGHHDEIQLVFQILYGGFLGHNFESEVGILDPDDEAEASLPAKVHVLEIRDIASLSCCNRECMAASPDI